MSEVIACVWEIDFCQRYWKIAILFLFYQNFNEGCANKLYSLVPHIRVSSMHSLTIFPASDPYSIRTVSFQEHLQQNKYLHLCFLLPTNINKTIRTFSTIYSFEHLTCFADWGRCQFFFQWYIYIGYLMPKLSM